MDNRYRGHSAVVCGILKREQEKEARSVNSIRNVLAAISTNNRPYTDVGNEGQERFVQDGQPDKDRHGTMMGNTRVMWSSTF